MPAKLEKNPFRYGTKTEDFTLEGLAAVQPHEGEKVSPSSKNSNRNKFDALAGRFSSIGTEATKVSTGK